MLILFQSRSVPPNKKGNSPCVTDGEGTGEPVNLLFIFTFNFMFKFFLWLSWSLGSAALCTVMNTGYLPPAAAFEMFAAWER